MLRSLSIPMYSLRSGDALADTDDRAGRGASHSARFKEESGYDITEPRGTRTIFGCLKTVFGAVTVSGGRHPLPFPEPVRPEGPRSPFSRAFHLTSYQYPRTRFLAHIGAGQPQVNATQPGLSPAQRATIPGPTNPATDTMTTNGGGLRQKPTCLVVIPGE